MDIASYLADQKSRLGSRSKLVKDHAVFDFHHIPQEPLMRQECKALIDSMLQFDMTGLADHHAVVGSRGSGKTLTVKYLQGIMPAHTGLRVLYANCRHYNTSFKIFAHLLGVQARGASLGELFERFCRTAEGKTVVVLDEVDLMSIKDRRRDILYFLSRAEKPFMIIMLSNSPQVLKELDGATRSSLQPIPLYFKHYNAHQLEEILRDRARRGLHSRNDGQLAQIAAMTARLAHSDARVAIKTLLYTVTGPDETLEGCFERARQDVVIDQIMDLADPALMILWATSTSRSAFAKDIYQRYCRFSTQYGDKPFSYVYFHSNLSYLQSAGLVALVATKVGRTHANRVELTFDRNILTEICQLRFEG